MISSILQGHLSGKMSGSSSVSIMVLKHAEEYALLKISGKEGLRANSVIRKGGLLDLFHLHSKKYKKLIQRHLTFLYF